MVNTELQLIWGAYKMGKIDAERMLNKLATCKMSKKTHDSAYCYNDSEDTSMKDKTGELKESSIYS